MAQEQIGRDAVPAAAGLQNSDAQALDALGSLALEMEASPRRQASLWGDAWRRLVRNRLALLGLAIVVIFFGVAIFASFIAPYGQNEVVDVRLISHGPSWTWPFGLDRNARDIFSRILFGAQISLMVGVVSQLVVVFIGVPVGALAGYYSGLTDNLLMRFVDVIYAIPQVLLVLLFVNWRGPGLTNVFLAIGLIGWVTVARLVRGQFLTLREQEYVKAARVAGASGPYIILRHLLPNSLTPIIVTLSFGIPAAIFTEASISYIGVGIQPPQASWGQMVGEAAGKISLIQQTPHLLLFPVAAIGLTMLGFTFLGDGLRDALDPKGND